MSNLHRFRRQTRPNKRNVCKETQHWGQEFRLMVVVKKDWSGLWSTSSIGQKEEKQDCKTATFCKCTSDWAAGVTVRVYLAGTTVGAALMGQIRRCKNTGVQTNADQLMMMWVFVFIGLVVFTLITLCGVILAYSGWLKSGLKQLNRRWWGEYSDSDASGDTEGLRRSSQFSFVPLKWQIKTATSLSESPGEPKPQWRRLLSWLITIRSSRYEMNVKYSSSFRSWKSWLIQRKGQHTIKMFTIWKTVWAVAMLQQKRENVGKLWTFLPKTAFQKHKSV